MKFFEKEKINVQRQVNFDFLKAVSILAMIFCHTILMLGRHREGYSTDFLFILGDTILGKYFGVAHAFMFCMGMGFCYSRTQDSKSLFVRGLKLYILAYVFNFFRYGIYAIAGTILDPSNASLIPLTIVGQDILQFAGLAMMLAAVFRKINLDVIWVVVIAVVMNLIGTFVGQFDCGSIAKNVLVGHLFYTVETASCFPLFNWFLFVALGMLFSKFLRRVESLDKFYLIILIVSLVISVAYISLTFVFGKFFLSKNHNYYTPSIFEVVCLLSLDLLFASIMHFALRKVDMNKITIVINLSKWVTPMYVIHWLILGFIESLTFWLLGISLEWYVIYLLAVGLIVVAYLIQMCREGIKNRKNAK